MKTLKGILAAGLMVLALTGCGQSTEDVPVESRMVSLNIGANIQLSTEIAEWGSGTDSDLEMNGTSRAETCPVNRLAFVLLNEKGEKVVSQEKGSEESGFLTLQARVPIGTYELIAFGHKGAKNAVIGTDASVGLSGEKLTDSFLHYSELVLENNVAKEKEITLKRCVSRISVKCKDDVPADAATIEVKVIGAGNVLDARTGFAKELSEQQMVFQIPSDVVGETEISFSGYLFLASKEDVVDLEVTVKDADGEVMTNHQLKDVPVKVNVKTICSGILCHANQSLNATFDAEWDGTEDIEF